MSPVRFIAWATGFSVVLLIFGRWFNNNVDEQTVANAFLSLLIFISLVIVFSVSKAIIRRFRRTS